MFKIPVLFHYTAWSIGIPLLDYWNPQDIGMSSPNESSTTSWITINCPFRFGQPHHHPQSLQRSGNSSASKAKWNSVKKRIIHDLRICGCCNV